MKLIKLTCPNCNANLEISTDNKECTCQYCRTPILLDEEIIKVEHTIKDDILNEKIKVANTHLYEFEDYQKAHKTYKELSEEYPYEPLVWWGLILSITNNLTKVDFDDDFSGDIGTTINVNQCNEYFNKYLKVEKNEIRKEENKQKYDIYIGKLIGKLKIDSVKIGKEELKDGIKFFLVWLILICIILSLLVSCS